MKKKKKHDCKKRVRGTAGFEASGHAPQEFLARKGLTCGKLHNLFTSFHGRKNKFINAELTTREIEKEGGWC